MHLLQVLKRNISKKHYKTNYCLFSFYKQKLIFQNKNSQFFLCVTREVLIKFPAHTSSAFSVALYFDLLMTIEITTSRSDFQISEEVYAYFYLYL